VTFLYIITVLALGASLIADRAKTIKALRVAWKKFSNILPAFLQMLLLVSILLYLVPDEVIIRHMGGKASLGGLFLGLFFGSITMMPGFIAFPLGGILLSRGVSYMVLAAFTTSLMVVGVVTFPIEREYLGTRVALIRNLVAVLISAAVALAMGIAFGELL